MQDRIVRICATCVLLLSVSTNAWTQAEAARSPLALPDAVALTLEFNPVLRARGFEIAAAEGRLTQARFRPNAELGIRLEDFLGSGALGGTDNSEATITLGWVLERDRRAARIGAARAGVGVGTAEVEIVRLDAAAETARRFLDCLALQARLGNAEAGIELAQQAVEAVSRRVAAGRARESELARAEAELVRAELIHEDYEHELESAYYLLSAQWAEAEPSFSQVVGELRALPEVASVQTLWSRVNENPDIERFLSQQRLHEAELRLAQARGRPNWSLSAGLRHVQATGDVALVGGVSIPLRLGNRNQGNIAETRAELARSEAETEAARVSMRAELFVLYQEFQHNVHLVRRFGADVVPRFERALADTRRAFELGRADYLEMRAVQTELLGANNELLEAYVDAHGLVIEIERLTGVRLAPEE